MWQLTSEDRPRTLTRPVHGEFQLRLNLGIRGCYDWRMRHLTVLLVHLITTVLKLSRPGGVRAVVAESVLAKHQLLILNRSRRRSPNLRVLDRIIAGFCSLWIKPSRFCRVAIDFKLWVANFTIRPILGGFLPVLTENLIALGNVEL